MITLTNRMRPTWLAMAAIAVMFSAWLIYVIGRGEVIMLGNLVDDSLYYLVMAYSFAHGGGWSLDQITRTSGYHVLYTLAYARGVNLIADHYSAPVILPVALLTCQGLAMCGRYWGAPAAGLLLSAAFVCLTGSWSGFPAHFVIARKAPDLIAHAESESRVAGWNVGVASWRSGRRIVNLDGLANAEVVDSLTSGTLAC